MAGGWVVVTREQSNFKSSQLEGGEGAVYMQVGWERCRKMMDAKSRAHIVMSCCKSIIQGDAFW
jgi:hypothetical protein